MKYLTFLFLFLSSLAVAQNPQSQTSPSYAVNAKYVNGIAPGYAPTAGRALNLNISSGTALCSSLQQYSGGVLVMSPNTTNYIYLDINNNCLPTVSTSNFNVSTQIPLAIVTTTSVITSINDARTQFAVGIGGSGPANITNQANGVIPLATAPSAIGAQSHLDDGVTNTNIITASRGMYGNFNKVISVIAPPYNAKCDGITDDQVAIQAAFDDARTQNASIQFPAGTCLFSTINYKGQSFSGAGLLLTTLKGQPGQDDLQGPDTAFVYPSGTYIHDLRILVDASVNAAATAAGGNNSFPNRITGTAGGTTPLPASSGGPPAPGQPHFGPGGPTGSCSAVVTNSSTTVTMSCGKFTAASTDTIINQPISLTTTDGTLTTTIASVTNATTIVIASPWPFPNNSSASGSWGTPYNTPWYVGNCGIALPNSDHNVAITGAGAWIFKNVRFDSTTSNVTLNSHNCGLFIQTQAFDMHYEKVDFQHLGMGYVEAFPALNMSAAVTWTPDTSTYKDINFFFNRINAVFYNGIHRVFDGINVYTGNNPMMLGFWQFTYAQGGSTDTVTHYYNECWTPNTGEMSRFGATPTNISGGSLSQCGTYPPPNDLYINFTGSMGTIDAQVSSIHVSGDGNIFRHTNGPSANAYVTDTGQENNAQGVISSGATFRNVKKNRPREGLGGVDAGYLTMGNSLYPFASADDLISTCTEWTFPFLVANGAPGCTPDYTIVGGNLQPSADGNIFGSYAHLTLANYPSGFTLGNGGAFGNSPIGKQFILGDRLPQNPSNILNIIGRCDNPCTQTISIRDARTNASLGSGTLTFGTTWTSSNITGVNLNAGTLAGDIVNINFGAIAGSGVTYEDLEVVGWEPSNADATSSIAQTPSIETLISSNTLPPNIVFFPCSMRWGQIQPSTACNNGDTLSPTGQSATFLHSTTGGTAVYLTDVQGSPWLIGTQTQARPTTFLVWGYTTTPFTETVTVTCNAVTKFTTSITWTTSYAAYRLDSVPLNTCSPADPINIRFLANPTTDLIIGGVTQVPIDSSTLGTASGQYMQTCGPYGGIYTPCWGNGPSGTYAPLASPAFTGTPTAPTATLGTNTTQLATTAFVQAATATGTPRVAYGYCAGGATSSATLILSQLGASGANCTSTVGTSSIAMPLMPSAGTLSNLSVRCGTTGFNSSSGVFTVYIIPSGTAANGGSATGLTVTYGTTTANTVVKDSTHTAAYNAGDSFQVRFTTQATETLANCTASVNY